MLKEKIESSLNKAQKRNPDFCGMRKVNLVWIQSTTQYCMNIGMSNLNFRYVRLCDEDIPREKKKKKKKKRLNYFNTVETLIMRHILRSLITKTSLL